ncbi:hypothetical protein [Marinomonas sp. THO17]|uniref:hypothetical protein n=1 Tax=Marinomonas sp. THO17 TaxID=3149048 RepID=UPI00336BB10A
MEVEDLGYQLGGTQISAGLAVGGRSFSYQPSYSYYQSNIGVESTLTSGRYILQGSYDFNAYQPEQRQDEIQDHLMALSAAWRPIPSSTILLAVDLKDVEEERGTGLTADLIDIDNSLSSYQQQGVDVNFSFNRIAERSPILTVSYNKDIKEYDQKTDLALNANFENESFGISSGYRWSDKKIFYYFRKRREIYPNALSKNSTNYTSSLGFAFPLTLITDFSLSFGKENKEFDREEEEEQETTYWSGEINWKPYANNTISIQSINQQNPLTKENQTLNEENELSVFWEYKRSSIHSVSVGVSNKKSIVVIDGKESNEESISIKIDNDYKDFIFSLLYKREEDVNSEKYWSLGLSVSYRFSGVI